jgi:hypothetical protein
MSKQHKSPVDSIKLLVVVYSHHLQAAFHDY